MTDFPFPGDTFDGRTVIASGWHSDDVIVVLSLATEAPFYRVEQIPIEGASDRTHIRWTFQNIVPAAAWLEETSGLWGGDVRPIHEEVVSS